MATVETRAQAKFLAWAGLICFGIALALPAESGSAGYASSTTWGWSAGVLSILIFPDTFTVGYIPTWAALANVVFVLIPWRLRGARAANCRRGGLRFGATAGLVLGVLTPLVLGIPLRDLRIGYYVWLAGFGFMIAAASLLPPEAQSQTLASHKPLSSEF